MQKILWHKVWRIFRNKTRAALSSHLTHTGRQNTTKGIRQTLENLWEVHISLIYKLREKNLGWTDTSKLPNKRTTSHSSENSVFRTAPGNSKCSIKGLWTENGLNVSNGTLKDFSLPQEDHPNSPMKVKVLVTKSCPTLCNAPQTVAMEFSRQENWSG